jgi:hypothetical protein
LGGSLLKSEAIMSDHDWTQEQLAAYVTGGLSADEAGKVDRHIAGCSDCAAALAAERDTDRHLRALFADVRPGFELEDTVVRSTRTLRPRMLGSASWWPRVAIAACLLLAVGMVGSLAEGMIRDGQLAMPGQARNAHAIDRVATAGSSGSMPDPDDPKSGVTDLRHRELTELRDQKSDSMTDYFAHQQLAQGGIGGGGISGIGGIGGGISGGIGGGISGYNGGFGGGIGGGGFGGGGVGGGGGFNNWQYGNTPMRGTLFNLRPTSPNSSPPVAYGGMNEAEKLATGLERNGKSAESLREAEAARQKLPGIQQLTNEPAKSPPITYSFKPSQYRGDLPTAEPAQNKGTPVNGQIIAGRPTQGQVQKQDLAFRGFVDVEGAANSNQPAEDAAPRRIVIRSGEMEFEVVAFDSAVAAVAKLVGGINGAFVATVNSEKLANGKVRGSVTIRTPPEHLDRLVAELRRELGAGGELKGMRIASQDITKQYTDLESRLRAARTMETRLLQIIKDGKGEIKQLLEAEKELGVWRTKIEEFEGEIRYYSNLVSLSTLTVTLTEKEIRAAASITENERVQAGIETDDVDKAYQQTLAAVLDAKGRVTKSDLKQLAAGQFNATVQFEVPPDAAGPMRDRLRQLGRMARLEIDRVQHAVDGVLPTEAKVKRGDTQFNVQIYNLANIAPRETITLQVAVPDVRAGYQGLRDAAGKANARVLTAQLNEQDVQNMSAQVDLEIRRPEEGAIRAALDAAGETVSRQVARAPENDDSTDTKMLYRVSFVAANRLAPREITALTVEVQDVEQSAAALAAQVAEAKGRQLNSQSARDANGKVTTRVAYEVPLDAASAIGDKIKSAGTVVTRQSARDPQAVGGKFATARFDVTLTSRDPIVGEDAGLWPQVRRGLTYSMTVLLTSLTWVVFGLCVVLPWGLAGYAMYRLFRRKAKQPATSGQV